MAIISEIEETNNSIKYRWNVKLSNGISGKQIEIDNTLIPYIITKNQKVYNVDTEKEKKFSIGTTGYYIVNLYISKNGKYKTRSIHRLMAEAFIENPENLPIINHIDGNKLNDEIENLEWCTYSYNNKHAYDTGLKTPSCVSSEKCNLTLHDRFDAEEVCYNLKFGYTPKAMHEMFGIDYDFAAKIFQRKTWKNVSQYYDFSNVILYNKFFTIPEIRKMKKYFNIGLSIKEICELMNWEYDELLRGRLRQFKKQLKRYNDNKK